MKVDIVGDIHGCYDEFYELTKSLSIVGKVDIRYILKAESLLLSGI